jgi:hypothetical protein
MSARAPDIRERKSSGRVAEATIKPTHVLDRVSSNMSQDPATVWMKVPVAENTVAAQRERKFLCRRGATAELTRRSVDVAVALARGP